jgi:SAM-dependent methyltransferase
MSFQKITGEAYTDLLRRRLFGDLPELTWVQQFCDILRPLLKSGTSIVDFGCASGYAYKAFRDIGVRYYGIDFEQKYLEIARYYFAGDSAATFIAHDITAMPSPIRAEIAICSATIEHAPSLLPTLKHIADAAEKVFVLRTFLAHEEEIVKLPSPVHEWRDVASKYNNAYEFSAILRALHDLNFQTTIHRDRYTDSLPYLVDGLARTFYVLVSQRPAEQKAGDPRRI